MLANGERFLLFHLLFFYLRFSRPYLYNRLIAVVYKCILICSCYSTEHGGHFLHKGTYRHWNWSIIKAFTLSNNHSLTHYCSFQIYDWGVNISYRNVNRLWLLRYVISLWDTFTRQGMLLTADTIISYTYFYDGYVMWMQVPNAANSPNCTFTLHFPKYTHRGHVLCCYQKTARLWKRTRGAKEKYMKS